MIAWLKGLFAHKHKFRKALRGESKDFRYCRCGTKKIVKHRKVNVAVVTSGDRP